MDVQLLFIVGTGRCGSTIVARTIAGHPEIGFMSGVEERFDSLTHSRLDNVLYRQLSRLPRPRTSAGAGRKTRVPKASRRRLEAILGPTEGYNLLARKVSPVISTPYRDLTAEDVAPWIESRFRRFFDAHARGKRTPVFLHKFTGWPRTRFIQQITPTAKFVHVVRDGRAVANSLVQVRFWRGHRGASEWTYGPLPESYRREWEDGGHSFALLAGLEWELLMDAFDAARSDARDGTWIDIRYEDFVADPRRWSAAILDFAGVRWTTSFERHFAAQQIRPGRTSSYRAELTDRDVALLDTSLADHLALWGYTTD